MSSAEYTIGQAMNEIQELSDRIELLGNIVDKYEMGDVDNIRSVGTMLEEFAGRLYRVRVSLEEDYKLPDLEEGIEQLLERRKAEIKEDAKRTEKDLEVFRRHREAADREIDREDEE